jgi:DNA-binding NarL/FixJ family response regulator
MESNEGGVIPPRLRPIASGLAEGLENHEIAERCALAKHTVEEYVHQLKERLGEPNRGRLILRCREMVEKAEI